MQRNKTIMLFLVMMSVISSCIETFDPHIEESDQGLYVVSGQVTDQEGYQYISVSLSSGVNEPEFIQVSGCTVRILDGRGNIFPMEDLGNGQYRAWMDKADLNPGTAYRASILTPSGLEIVSDDEIMPACPPIDTIYYLIESEPTDEPGQSVDGIRFYTDVNASGYDSYFFRWEIEETWEYHMDYVKEFYYDGTIQKIDPPDHSTEVCWYTGNVNDIFIISTLNLSQNVYHKYPLHFVDNTTTKLTQLYSMLITQSAITERAYLYWDKLRVNSQNQGGLYEEQPLPVDGNLHVPSAPATRVLGYFGASSCVAKRIFISEVEDLVLEPEPLCNGPVPLGIFGWEDFEPEEYPVYFIRINGTVFTLEDNCVDCLLFGGVNVKPDFWPR